MLAETEEFRGGRLRHEDYSLSDEQEMLRVSYERMLAEHSSPERLRQVERLPDRFDLDLWSRMAAMGAPSLSVPAADGGSGATLVDLSLVAEELGRAGAATPFAECAVAGRLLPSLAPTPREEVAHALCHAPAVISLALHPATDGGRQLIPCGTVADAVLVHAGERLVLARDARGEAPPNLAGAPIAWWELDLERATVLLRGDPARRQFGRLVRGWKLLTAAALVGVAQAALTAAARYAADRTAFGVPIGAFQGVSHPLADVFASLGASRRLVWRAAWFEDHDAEAAPELVPMAAVAASEVASRAVQVAVHTQGGLGVCMDADMQLFYRRAKGWPVIAGPPTRDLREVADLLRSRRTRAVSQLPERGP